MKPLPTQPCCCHPAKHSTPHPARHLGVTLLSAITWLFIPKCPVCLSAYIFTFTGASLTFSTSTFTHKLLLTIVVAVFLYSMFRLTISLMRQNRSRIT
ncbi:hypothetical protein [Lacunimicrobium album]